MKPASLDLGVFTTGDSAGPWTFRLTRTVDGATTDEVLTGASAAFTVKNEQGVASHVATLDEGVSISGSEITVAQFTAPGSPGNHKFDLQITYPSGRVATYLHGKIKTVQGVTA